MSVLLIVLDGWGYSDQDKHNAIAAADTPNWDSWWQTQAHTFLDCSGPVVGLPAGQMGNSEVGHMHIGAGRTLLQDFSRIDTAIDDGEFFQNPTLLATFTQVANAQSQCHLIGLLSPGGVHSHERHLHALIRLAHQVGVQNLCLHAILDGRDTPPQSAQTSITALEQLLAELGIGKIVTLSGRYYAMDRDQRWPRTEAAITCMQAGQAALQASDASSALQAAYERGENDEFVQPTVLGDYQGMHAQDSLVFTNFRADRMRQLVRGFITDELAPPLPFANVVSMTQYADDIDTQLAFPPQVVNNSFGEWLAKHDLSQYRIAETEKYAHVTFFFNGGVETVFVGETRELIPSPQVATYDLQPQMSAPEITTALVNAINSEAYAAIICNYANADMVGHSGDFTATMQAIACVDKCLGEVVQAARAHGMDVFITADHGNAEKMFDENTGQAHTAHTSTPVPLLYIGDRELTTEPGSLIDISPTLLDCLALPIAPEMTGRSLLKA